MILRLLRASIVGVAALALTACSDPTPSASVQSVDTTTGGSCTGNLGTLAGSVYYWSLPGNPDSEPAIGVDALLHHAGDTLRVTTDGAGAFSVEVEAGSYSVGADDGGGCIADVEPHADVAACQTSTVDVVLDLCTG